MGADAPVSGAALARETGVSRQVIVQDVALLRSQGLKVVSTNRGYLIGQEHERPRRTFKVCHTPEETERELTGIVDLGGTVEDVFVNHRTYGIVSAPLGVSSRRDVRRFLDEISSSRSSMLSVTTSGYHFHHVSADSEEVLDDVQRFLDEAGFTAELLPWEHEE